MDSTQVTSTGDTADDQAAAPRRAPESRLRLVPLIITLITIALAGWLGWAAWNAYMGTPWTRDATVRAYVIAMAPEVEGVSSSCPSLITGRCTRAISWC